MSPIEDPLEFLQRTGRQRDEAIDLALSALSLSALDHPEAVIDPYLRHLKSLVDSLREVGAEAITPQERQAALIEVFVRRFDYHGDPMRYDDPQNGDLLCVIDRRKGLPVALGILYLSTARAVGWGVSGLNFPNHFLIRLDAPDGGLVIDPFHDGRALDLTGLRSLLQRMTGSDDLLPEHCQPMLNRDILLRLLNNLKGRALSNQDFERAATMIERMILVAPGYYFLYRELGAVRFEQGKIRAAMSAFQSWKDLATDASERAEAQGLIEGLRRQLN